MQKGKNRQILSDIADVITSEISMANSVENGYNRIFRLPETLNSINYNLTILYDEESDHKELVITFVNNSENYEHVEVLPKNVAGNLVKGENNLTKLNDAICINLPECS